MKNLIAAIGRILALLPRFVWQLVCEGGRMVHRLVAKPADPMPAAAAAPIASASDADANLVGVKRVAAVLAAGRVPEADDLRPYLERVTGLDISMLSLVLLIMGLAGIAGTYVISRLLSTRLFSLVIAIPLVMAVIAGLLVVFGSSPVAVAGLLLAWGAFSTAAPVGWGTWLSKALPNDAEAGGGLQVATIQLAITIGAAGGGLLFDAVGWWSPFALAVVLLCGSSLLAIAAWRCSPEIKP